MNAPDSARLNGVFSRIESGLRVHAEGPNPRRLSVSLADDLAVLHDETVARVPDDDDETPTVGEVLSKHKESYRRLRKITEIVEDGLQIDLGHSKFTRLASTASEVSSVWAFVVAGNNLLISADALDHAREQASHLSGIKERYFHDFYHSIVVFIANGIFLWSPIKYKFAWKGTRYLNNRVLYRFRKLSPKFYRLLLSEVHYAIRGLPSTALTNVDKYAQFFVSVGVKTLRLLGEFGEVTAGDLVEKADTVVSNFESTLSNAYELSVPDIDFDSLVADIAAEVDGSDVFDTVPHDWREEPV